LKVNGFLRHRNHLYAERPQGSAQQTAAADGAPPPLSRGVMPITQSDT